METILSLHDSKTDPIRLRINTDTPQKKKTQTTTKTLGGYETHPHIRAEDIFKQKKNKRKKNTTNQD